VRVRIPAINVDHQVVMGDDEDALRRGIGYHIGSANPGMRGNMVLSAHNDAYGQIFRYLDQLNPGDEIFVHTMSQEFRYIVSDSQVVEPLDTWVMQSTQTPTLTLISCYPYMVDTHRIVVFADLEE
jgi:sortase A